MEKQSEPPSSEIAIVEEMIQRAHETGRKAEIMDSYWIYRKAGNSVEEAARWALKDWND